jgi:hypothetical protein
VVPVRAKQKQDKVHVLLQFFDFVNSNDASTSVPAHIPSIAAASTSLSKHLKECKAGEEIDPLLLLLLLLTPVKERLEGFTVEEEE